MSEQLPFNQWLQNETQNLKDTPGYWLEEVLYEFAEKVEKELEAQHISQRELSRKIGMKESQLSRYLHGPDNITLKTMIDILAGLDMKLKFSCVPTQEEKIVFSDNSCSANSSDESYRFNLSCTISDTQYLKIPETLNETQLCNNTYQVPDNIEKEPS